MFTNKTKHPREYGSYKPANLVAATFLVVIFIGAILLTLPAATASGSHTNLVDAMFMSASAVCVTGMSIYPTYSHWSFFGKFVIMVLMQIGGIGLMTFITMISVMAGKKITLRQRLLIKDSFNQPTAVGMVKLLKYVVFFTIAVEGVFSLVLMFVFLQDYPLKEALSKGIFHSISAFCNAGFDTIGNRSLTDYSNNFVMNISIMFLVIAGGLGFPVWMDLRALCINVIKKKRRFKFALDMVSVHTKMVLILSGILIILPSIFFFVVEYSNPATIGTMSIADKASASLFQSVTCRTAGFLTIDQSQMTYASKLVTVILMFIGGSPAGTAGGIKTTTVGVLIAAVLSLINGKERIHLFGRKVRYSVVQKALTVFLLGQLLVVSSTILLTITEAHSAFPITFMDCFYEAASAFSTAGITLGMTPHLSSAGKIILCVIMFIGRLGPMTVAATLTTAGDESKKHIDYPEGKILIG